MQLKGKTILMNYSKAPMGLAVECRETTDGK